MHYSWLGAPLRFQLPAIATIWAEQRFTDHIRLQSQAHLSSRIVRVWRAEKIGGLCGAQGKFPLSFNGTFLASRPAPLLISLNFLSKMA
jgi:hypothetical protein